MGRSKVTARRGKPPSDLITVGFHGLCIFALPRIQDIKLTSLESWPNEFIDQLRTLLANNKPPPNGQGASEPPPKRVKRASDGIETLLVAQEELEVVRKYQTNASDALELADGPLIYKDVGSQLLFRFGWQKDLRIVSRARTGPTTLNMSVMLHPNAMSDRLETCLDVFSTRSTKPDGEGDLGVSVDVILHIRGDYLHLGFRFSLYWNETKSPYARLRTTAERKQSQKVMDVFLPEDRAVTSKGESWSPLDFYEAAHVPSANDKRALSIEVPDLTASLYPYQKKTLNWLLKREGVQWKGSDDGPLASIESLPPTDDSETAHSFRKIQPESEAAQSFYISHLYHLVTTNLTPFQQAEQSVRGGILAEEMGLGKTLEVIGLVALHRRPFDDGATITTREGEELLVTGATLIVTPDSLRQQWISEIQRHAPHLRVKYYPGRKHAQFVSEEGLREDLASQDVVITTYPTLSAELHFALKPPERSRRQERKYDRPESPLTKISWWRVCLDEAQMIESGVTAAAAVARLLPRINAWGVTGTPVKNDVKDLFGLLNFLRYEPYASSPQIWRALTDSHKPLFRSLFGAVSLRHTKQLVRHEIAVPPQKRFVITMPFTAVEEQYYGELFKNMARACAMDSLGQPLKDDWNLEQYEAEMRTWLNRLRQAALHPEIVQRRGAGRKVGPMRTVDEVLDAMIEQGDNDIRGELRAYLQSKLLRGQMLENGPRVKEALEVWESVKKDASLVVEECREEVAAVVKEAQVSRPTSNQQEQDDSSAEGEQEDSDE